MKRIISFMVIVMLSSVTLFAVEVAHIPHEGGTDLYFRVPASVAEMWGETLHEPADPEGLDSSMEWNKYRANVFTTLQFYADRIAIVIGVHEEGTKIGVIAYPKAQEDYALRKYRELVDFLTEAPASSPATWADTAAADESVGYISNEDLETMLSQGKGLVK